MKYLGWFVAVLWVAVGCQRSELQHEDFQGVPIEVPLELSFASAGQLGASSKAAQDSDTTCSNEGAIEAQIAKGEIDPASKTVDEDKVANVWVLQFDGTAPTSRLVYKNYVASYTSGSSVKLYKAKTGRVAVVANTFDAAWGDRFTVGATTWGGVSGAVKAVAEQTDLLVSNSGTDYLPISGSYTGAVSSGTPVAVPLIRTLVKVVVKLKSGAELNATEFIVQMGNVANTSAWLPDTESEQWPISPTTTSYPFETVTGITTTDYKTLTYWVPINRRGKVAGTTSLLRAKNAPMGATFLKIWAGGWAYTIHLGADFATDYNLQANTAYTYDLTLNPNGLGTDSRVEGAGIGELVALPMPVSGAGGVVTVSSPNALPGLVWTAAAEDPSVTVGAVTGSGPSASVPVTVGVNPTDQLRPLVVTASAAGGLTSQIAVQQAASSFAPGMVTIPATAGAVSVPIVQGTDGLTYSVAQQSGYGFMTLKSTTGTISNGVGQVSISATANSGAARSAVFTVTCTNVGTTIAPIDVTVWQSRSGTLPSQTVEVGGVVWATGNLVASNATAGAQGTGGCKIGAPGDGGLYFQFGSLIGYKGGNQANGGTGVGMPQTPLTKNGSFWNGSGFTWASDAMVWPTEMTSNPSVWPSNFGATAGDRTTVVDQWFFNYNTAPYSTSGQDIRGFAGSFAGDKGSGTLATGRYAKWGVGDPCTYYLGGNWRLPTTAELASVTGKSGNGWVVWTTAGVPGRWATASQTFGGVSGPGAWFGAGLSAGAGAPNPSVNPFFPAAGYRNFSNGAFTGVNTDGYYWNSSVFSAKSSDYLFVQESYGVLPQGNTGRSNGFPVRCVLGEEPDYVEVNGLKWATGNLVAATSTAGTSGGCKIGTPTDGGLYFQFGSLIGYKGGAQTNGGTGVGMPQAPLTTNGTYWNGSGFTWASDAMVWPTEMTSNPSSWPNNNGSSAGDRNTVVDQWFFNFNTAPYSSAGQDIRGFSGSFAGDKGSGTLGTGRYAKWGIGDPCTYYLGGTWRLPTTNEIVVMCNNQSGYGQNIAWGSCGASWTTSPVAGGNFYSNKLFFPASGYRDYSNGSFTSVTAYGIYWSSSVYNATLGLSLDFNSSWVCPQRSNSRSYGFPVRCVAK